MALIKSKSWKYGLDITYWMIGNINIQKEKNMTTFYLYGYINKEHRKNLINDFCETIQFDIIGANRTYEELYDFIRWPKLDPNGDEVESFFIDAEDDI